MEVTQPTNRIHPLIAGAAVSVTLVSLLGAAAIAGILPNSHSGNAPAQSTVAPAVAGAPAVQAPAVQAPAEMTAEAPKQKPVEKKHTVVRNVHHYHAPAKPQTMQVAQRSAPTYTQPAVYQPAPVPAPQAVAQQHSTIGIATGAVIGGLLGNQVGNGNGRTLATVAGAIGGGYLGNEIGKKAGY